MSVGESLFAMRDLCGESSEGDGVRQMRRLTRASYFLVKAEVDGMSPSEARELWGRVERFWVGVCARASARRRDQGWVSLMRKMDLVRRKAQEGQP